MDWISDHAWQLWLGLAMVLGVAEMFSLDLVLLMLATGALVGMTMALISAPFLVQVLAAAGTSVAMLWLVRPSVVKRLHSGPTLQHGPALIIGAGGVALEEITRDTGLAKIKGETWTARPYDEHIVIPAGSRLEVFEVRGATAYVGPVAELEA